MARILVTGGAGFIGSHLCKALVNQGDDVICLDSFFTGSKRNVLELLGSPNFELMRHDVINPFMVEVDQVYNLACPASPIHYQYNAIKTVRTNVVGTLNALGLTNRVDAKMLQASTSEVYGDPTVHPQTEDYWGHVNPLGPRACYDEGKRVAETLCMDYKRQNNVKVKIVRIFNTYGPNMALNDGRVVSNFIIQALRGQPLTIYGSGEQTRSFCYVSDLIRGFLSMMNQTPDDLVGPVNLGNPVEITMKELADTILSLTNSTSKLQFKPLPVDDPKRRCPDISKAKSLLGWEPRVVLREGLAETIRYFDHLLSSGTVDILAKPNTAS